MTNAARAVRKQITDWLQNQLLGEVLRTLGDHETRIRTLEASMSALSDYLAEFRSQVDAETSRLGAQLADLQARLDASDQASVEAAKAELTPIVDSLKAMGTGGQADPLPAPPADVPPADTF